MLRARVFQVPRENLVAGRRDPGVRELGSGPIDRLGGASDSGLKAHIKVRRVNGLLKTFSGVPENLGGGRGRGNFDTA